MRLKKKLSSCVSCICFEGFGENEWWGAVFSACVCVCVWDAFFGLMVVVL